MERGYVVELFEFKISFGLFLEELEQNNIYKYISSFLMLEGDVLTVLIKV